MMSSYFSLENLKKFFLDTLRVFFRKCPKLIAEHRADVSTECNLSSENSPELEG